MKQKVVTKLKQKQSREGPPSLYLDLENLIQKTHSTFLHRHREIYDDITVDTAFAELVVALLQLHGDKEYDLKVDNDGVVIELGEYFNVIVKKSKTGLNVKFLKQG